VRSELGVLLRLAAPLILAQLSQMFMGVADVVMVSRVSATDMAGVTLGGNLYFPTQFLFAGVIMAVTPTIAQLHGAGRSGEMGEVVRQALWIALPAGVLLVVLFNNVEPAYHWIGVDARAIPVAVAYLHALSFGVMPLLCFFTMRYLCEGNSWTKPAMILSMLSLPMKVLLNYGFIYGNFGLPELGGAGCGYSSATIGWLQFTAMLFIIRHSRMRQAGVFNRFSWPDAVAIGRLIRLGVPIGLSNFLEMAVFSAVTLLIGRIGVEAVAAHQIAMNVGGLTFMIPMGIGMAAAIRVGFNTGAGDLEAARRSGWLAIRVAAVFAVAAAIVVLLGRHWIASLYTPDAAVAGIAASLLVFVALFQLFDDTQVTALGALRGYKDTKLPMYIALFAYWVAGFPVAVMLGYGAFGLEPMGPQGFWTGLTLGLAVAAAGLVWRFAKLSQDHARIGELARQAGH
jgi:MATE family multidrug resistance protein